MSHHDDVHTGHGSADRHAHSLAFMAVAALLLLGVCAIDAVGPAADVNETGIAADTIPAATLALGRRVYEGKAGGALCMTCHGPNAKGVAGLGPDLTDKTWLNGDGSRAFLVSVIRAGVPRPKQSSAPMPPLGGGSLDAEKLNAVAAYVYSLSH